MFGQSKPVVLESYGSRRKRGRPPRWLVLLISGVIVGAAGVVVVQERYLPPRLSQGDSARLRNDFETADAERLRLQQSLGETSQKLSTALAEKKTLADELAANRSTTERLRDDLSAVITALPPDPRGGGGVEIRAGRFATKGGALVYDVVLTRERSGKAMSGVLQLTAAGLPARGPETAVALKPVPLNIAGTQEIVRGSLALPEGFRPREITIQVLDRAGGRSFAMRVMLIK